METPVQYSEKLQAILAGREFKIAARKHSYNYMVEPTDIGLCVWRFATEAFSYGAAKMEGFVDKERTKGGTLAVCTSIISKSTFVTLDVETELELLD